MLGSPFLAILGPPGPSWAHLGPLSLPSCHPTSPLDTSMAELRPPKPHLASFVEPSTCPEHCYLRRFREVCYLPSSQHVTLNLALQNPKIKPKSPPRHPKIGPRSPKIAQDGPDMAPKTYDHHCISQRGRMFGNPFLAILGPLGPPSGLSSTILATNLPRTPLFTTF